MMKTYKDLKEYKALKNYTISLIALFFIFFMIGVFADFGNTLINISLVVVSAISIFYFSLVLKKL